MKIVFLIIIITTSLYCTSQEKSKTTTEISSILIDKMSDQEHSQIGQYIVSIFEDSKGNLWFGTLEKGVAKYDGEVLKYFTTKDGLIGNGVVSILEDKDGIMWFGTHSGLSKYDGTSFKNYAEKDGLCHFRISNLLIDSKGKFWIGTWGGVCLFDGNTFTNFPIPYPKMESIPNEDTKNWITEIMEDKKGNIWFGRDGNGAARYDGKTFTHFTKKEGLFSNNVQSIEEDKDGHIWFGTRVAEKDNPDPANRIGEGGLSVFDGINFTSYPDIEGLTKNDVYAICKDNAENIWVSTISNGMYKYDGKDFVNYKIGNDQNLPSKPVQSFLEDRNGNFWFGCSGGLYRLNSDGVKNITVDGPWE